MMTRLRKHRYVARASVFLIAVALIAGTVGCGPTGRYSLTVSSTEGGKVVFPGEGTFGCSGGREVTLLASPSTGYHFVNWTGDVSTIADINSTITTITICGDYSIMANFEESARGGCFIATAAYGTPIAEEMQTLREFRDEYLLTNSVGRAFVDFYYNVSPPIADFMTDHPSLKPIVRTGLIPVVAICSIVLDVVPQLAGNGAE